MSDQISNFNIIKWAADHNISLAHHGSNIGKGWIGICCPWCASDSGFHLGINKKSKKISCWKCSKKGSIVTLIQKLTPSENIQKILQKYSHGSKIIPVQESKNFAKICKLPENAVKKPLSLHKKYFESRNFDVKQLYKEYDLCSVGIDSSWSFRTIIPIKLNKMLMTFTARDVTGKAKIRYKACPIEQSVLDPKNVTYNIRNATNRLIIVEGASDVWRIGKGSAALMGATISHLQLAQIVTRNFQKIFILLDADATGVLASKEIGARLATFCEVEILTLPEGVSDPGNLVKEDVNALRKQIFNTIY